MLIDFWTYTCINCIRTLPYLRAWDSEYRDRGLTVIGVHTPEFAFEKETGNVEGAIDEYGLGYPVVQDNDRGTWDAFANQYWPAKYLIDADGHVRYAHFGEGAYEETESAIRGLLAEAGADRLGTGVPKQDAETADPGVRTPETYLGWERAQGFVQPPRPGALDLQRSRPRTRPPTPSRWTAAGGSTPNRPQPSTTPRSSSASGRGGCSWCWAPRASPGRVEVLLDGEPISKPDAGEDVRGGAATVTNQRLYRLVDLDRAGDHALELRFEPGVSGYAFTFG